MKNENCICTYCNIEHKGENRKSFAQKHDSKKKQSSLFTSEAEYKYMLSGKRDDLNLLQNVTYSKRDIRWGMPYKFSQI